MLKVIALTRGIGTYEEVKVTWSVTPFKPDSFVVSEGEALFSDGQQTTEVNISIWRFNSRLKILWY